MLTLIIQERLNYPSDAWRDRLWIRGGEHKKTAFDLLLSIIRAAKDPTAWRLVTVFDPTVAVEAKEDKEESCKKPM